MALSLRHILYLVQSPESITALIGFIDDCAAAAVAAAPADAAAAAGPQVPGGHQAALAPRACGKMPPCHGPWGRTMPCHGWMRLVCM